MPQQEDKPFRLDPATALFFHVADPEGLGKAAETVRKKGDSSNLMSLGQGVVFDPNTGEAFVPDVYQQQIQRRNAMLIDRMDRAARARAAQFGLTQQDKQQERARAPEKVFQESQDALRLASKADQVATQLQNMMNRGEGPKSFLGETAMEWTGDVAGGAVRKGIERMTFSEPERNLRAMMADLSTAIDQAKMKGVLSDQDLQRLQAASFNEPGISDTEALFRLQRAADILRESSQASMAGRQPPAGARPQPNLSGDNYPQGPADVRAAPTPTVAPATMPQRPEGATDQEWADYLWMLEQGRM